MDVREIKFRAWNKREMISYEDLLNGGNTLLDELYHGSFFVLPLTNIMLMQYTGLKDKNGVEIYEGDILRIYDSYLDGHCNSMGVIRYRDYRYSLYGTNQTSIHGKSDFYLRGDYDVEVIGNIYENKELLEQ